MIQISKAAAAAAILLASGAAAAEEIPSATGYVVTMKENCTAVVYHVEAPEGFRVVTTMAAEGGPLLRFVSILSDGESVTLEAAGEAGEPSAGVELTRVGDRLHVRGLPATVGMSAAAPRHAS